MKLLTVISLMVLASTASSNCYSGEWRNDYKDGPLRTDCGGIQTACFHTVMYVDGDHVELWGCGSCDSEYSDRQYCEDCSYDYCNYAGDDHDSGAGQLVMSTLSVLVPVALLY